MRLAGQQELEIVPVTFKVASQFVKAHHRHHKPPRGSKFCIAVQDETEVMRGVIMVGRPVARTYDTGRICEVNRACTDGFPNANSALYAAAWRCAKAMGYRTGITYTQAGESGSSLRAAGWLLVGIRFARGSWRESTADDRLVSMRDPNAYKAIDRFLWRIGRPLEEEDKQC